MTIEELAKKHGIAEMLQDGVESFARELVNQCAQIAEDGRMGAAILGPHSPYAAGWNSATENIAWQIRELAGAEMRIQITQLSPVSFRWRVMLGKQIIRRGKSTSEQGAAEKAEAIIRALAGERK